MILLEDVLMLHDASIRDFGGAKGIEMRAFLTQLCHALTKHLEVIRFIQLISKKLPPWQKV